MDKKLSAEISNCHFGENSEIFLRIHYFDPEAYGNYEVFECEVIKVQRDTSQVVFHYPGWIRGSHLLDGRTLHLCSADGKVFTCDETGTAIEFVQEDLLFMGICAWDKRVVAAANGGHVVILGENGTKLLKLNSSDQISCVTRTESEGFFVLTINEGLFEWKGSEFAHHELNTNVDLYDLFNLDDGRICICGERGVVLLGHPNALEIIPGTEEDLNNICMYKNELYFSAPEAGIFKLVDGQLVEHDSDVSPDAIYSDGLALYCASDNELLRSSRDGWSTVHKVHDPTGYYE